ncbi:glycerophosphodiester phosphodiesterase [Silvimonas iriomotensis]|uniref:Glycerophosphodiester phosphodiesterase n=1 Tax=Silvimonas iriomotensis TaxID=449662 RepID=A0ABQ2PEI8_9NEIS|nr:glycerophosphodiester phosphodiesterase [Silvimonas iriomotensis]GGP23915.1 glycerophosphodiester phosphodiesterase [Silvimonas iriomotensis]
MSDWPYPFLFAHRGGGRLAPENTLAGMMKATECGYRAVEFDVKLTADNVCVLLHDDTLERTSDGHGPMAQKRFADLQDVDAGSWKGEEFAGEPIPAFSDVGLYCVRNRLMANVEIKPCPGREVDTGKLVARDAALLWQGEDVPPLLSSFSYEALEAAVAAAPWLPVGWLVDHWHDDWAERLQKLEAVSLHCNHKILTAARVKAVREAGYHVLAYTVNDPERARELQGWGVSGVFTDALDAMQGVEVPA